MNTEYIRLCSIPAVQEKIVGNRKWITGDLYYNTLDRLCGVVDKSDVYAFNNDQTLHVIHLPQVHDLNDEKRGLLNILVSQEGVFSVDLEWQPGLIPGWRVSLNWYKDIHQFTGSTPELALLRALMHQWGIEEELADYKAANASIREELRCRIKERDKLEAELAAARREIERLRDALDTIEGMATDTTFDIQGVAKAALARKEKGR